MRVLRARLFEHERLRQRAEESAARRAQIGGGERAEKIRTYNFPENRLTDHRIKLTQHRLDSILAGRPRRVHRRADGRGAAARPQSPNDHPRAAAALGAGDAGCAGAARTRQAAADVRGAPRADAGGGARLRSLGIGPDDRVAILHANGPELAAAFFAVSSVAVSAPLNPAFRMSELDLYLADLHAKAMLVGSATDQLHVLADHRVVRLVEIEPDTSAARARSRCRPGARRRSSRPGRNGAPPPHVRDDRAAEARAADAPGALPLGGQRRAHARAATRGPLPERHAAVPHPRARRRAPLVALGRRERHLRAGLPRAVVPRLAPELEPTWYTAVPTMHQAVLARARPATARARGFASSGRRLRRCRRACTRGWSAPSAFPSSRPTA